MLSLSNPMQLEDHIPDFPFTRMPWFRQEHRSIEYRKCMQALEQNWYTLDAGIREWHDESGGQPIGQRYFAYLQGKDMNVAVQLSAPECITPPMRNYEPNVMTSCAVVNSLKKDVRRVFADTLCSEAVQNMEMARSTLIQPGGELDPHQENRDIIRKFMRGLNNQSYRQMSETILEWEKYLRDLYESIIDCRVGPAEDGSEST